MTDRSDAIDPETLLAHSGWVSGLARSLVADPGTADDVVQQTWLAALSARPRQPERLRAWLGGIVRHLAAKQQRGAARRVRRETAAARPEGLPSTEELVLRAELQRLLVDAVLALDEPSRGTVLLRYFGGLSAEEIARRQGVPGATVRARLARALAELRRRLDGRFDGGRDAWMVALGGLALWPSSAAAMATATGHAVGAGQGAVAGHGGAAAHGVAAGHGVAAVHGAAAGHGIAAGQGLSTTVAGAVAVTAKTKLVLAGGVLLAALGGPWLVVGSAPWATHSTADAGASLAPAPAVAADATGRLPAPAPATPEQLALAPGVSDDPAQTAPATAAPPAKPTATLTGLVLDADGAPLPGAGVRFAWHSNDPNGLLGVANVSTHLALHELPVTREVTTRTDGRFALDVDLENTSGDRLEGTLLVVRHDDHATRIHRSPVLVQGMVDTGPIRLARGARVTGRVVEDSGVALPGVDVELLELRPATAADVRSGPPLHEEHLAQALATVVRARSDGTGRFQLTGLAAGRVDLVLTRADRAVLPVLDVALDPARPVDLGTLVLDLGRSLGGQVVDGTGQPVPGAPVWVERQAEDDAAGRRDDVAQSDGMRSGERTQTLTATDADGRFRVGGLAAGLYTVHARAPNRVHAGSPSMAYTHRLDVHTGALDLAIVLEPPGEILLRVRDASSGLLLPGASVWVDLPEAFDALVRVLRSDDLRVRADEAGVHRITGAGREGTRITVKVPGYARQVVLAPAVAPQSTLDLDVLLEPALVFEGVVIDDADQPVAGAVVQVTPRSGVDTVTATGAHSNEQGYFRLDTVVPGISSIRAYADGHVPTDHGRIVLGETGSDRWVIRLVRRAIVAGTVLGPDGQPVPEAAVVALLREAQDALRPWQALPVSLGSRADEPAVVSRADEHGRYRFDALAPGSYALLATYAPDELVRLHSEGRAPAELLDAAVVVSAAGGAVTAADLELATGAVVTGQVSDADGPVAAAQVRIVGVQPGAERWPVLASGTADEQGRFRVAGLPDSAAWIAANAPSGMPRVRPVTLSVEAVAEVDVVLDGSTLAGRCIAAGSGAPLPDTWGWFSPGPWKTLATFAPEITRDQLPAFAVAVNNFSVEVDGDAEGRFVLRHVPPGTYRLSVHAPGYLDFDENVTPEDLAWRDERVLELARAAEVEGTVSAAEGLLPADLELRLYTPGAASWVAASRIGGGYASSRWTNDTVPPGAYELRVEDAAGQVLARRTITLHAGSNPAIDVILE